jgi:hypothetical protein
MPHRRIASTVGHFLLSTADNARLLLFFAPFATFASRLLQIPANHPVLA